MKLALLGLCIALAACNKPSAENCQKALENMQRLLGTDVAAKNDELQSEVRRCKGGSSREAVDCAIAAQSMDALRKCDFMSSKKK